MTYRPDVTELDSYRAICRKAIADCNGNPMALSIQAEKFGKAARGFMRQESHGMAQVYLRAANMAANAARLEYFMGTDWSAAK